MPNSGSVSPMDKRRTGLVGLEKRAEAASAGLRALGVLRISKRTEASSTIERHQKYITEACEKKGWNIVGWAIDRGVSATKKGPFDRPELGDWLNLRADEFDIIVVYRLDRISRNSQDTRDIMSWCTKQEPPKRLFCVNQEMIDFDPTNTSFLAKMAVEIFMAFATAHAQMEVENMGERWSDLKESAREIGYWSGGPAPYGFKTIVGRLPGATYDGKILVRNPDTFHVLERIIFEFHEENRRTTDIAADLNRDGFLSPMGEHRNNNPHVLEAHGDEPYTNSVQWQSQTVRRILLNRILIGEHASKETKKKKSEIFRDKDGVAVLYVEPTISRDVYDQICAKIRRAPNGSYSNRTLESLAGFATCVACGGTVKYHYTKPVKNGKVYEYKNYRCNNGSRNGETDRCKAGNKGIHLEMVHGAVDAAMQVYGNHPLYYSVTIPGSGSYDEIQRAEEAYASAIRTHSKAVEDGNLNPRMEEIFQAQLKQINDRYNFLVQQGVTPPRVELVPTGKTIADEWRGSNWSRRREILTMAGIHVGLDFEAGRTEIWDDGGVDERLRLWGEGSSIPAKHAAMIKANEKRE